MMKGLVKGNDASMWRNRHSVAFKLLVGYAAIVVALIISVSLVLQTSLRTTLEQETLKQVDTRGELIVAEFVRRATMVNTLTQSMVSLASSAQGDAELIRQAMPKLIDLSNSEGFIAGGGFWPEPFTFDSSLERASFFGA